MKEKDFQGMISQWLSKKILAGAGIPELGIGAGIFSLALELKICPAGRALPFSAVADHQARALGAAAGGGIVYKIPDSGQGLKPFDEFIMAGAKAFVVVLWYERGKGECVFIPIGEWMREARESKRWSLTEARAREMGLRVSFRG